MRARTVVAIVAMLLPAALEAQRLPRPGTKTRPGQPTDLPPAPTSIEMVLAVKRSRLTVESYPLVSRVQSPGFPSTNGLVSAWTTLGGGTRFDYRFSRFVSGTLDMTASAIGGPADFATAELGTRFHPARSESRFYPFADVRFGVMSSTTRIPTSLIDESGASRSPNDQYSIGFGGVAGIGTEYSLWRSWSLTTEVSVLRNRMHLTGLQASETAFGHYGMTWWRYSLGLSYNALRLIPVAGGDTR